jgi:hypothetical protein
MCRLLRNAMIFDDDDYRSDIKCGGKVTHDVGRLATRDSMVVERLSVFL